MTTPTNARRVTREEAWDVLQRGGQIGLPGFPYVWEKLHGKIRYLKPSGRSCQTEISGPADLADDHFVTREPPTTPPNTVQVDAGELELLKAKARCWDANEVSECYPVTQHPSHDEYDAALKALRALEHAREGKTTP